MPLKETDNMGVIIMEIISTNKALEMIREHKGAEFMSIITETVPDMNKRGNPYYENTLKVCEMNVCVGFDYERAVNRQRSREEIEEEFFARERKWGVRIDLKTVGYKGETYLTINPQSVLSVQYFHAGEEIDKNLLSEWIKEKQPSTTQGTEKEVIYRDVNIKNVKVIRMRGKTYKVV